MTNSAKNGWILITPKDGHDSMISILELANVKSTLMDNLEGKEFDARNYHAEINKHCRKLFVEANFFHSVFEAAKIYNKKVNISEISKLK